MIVGKVTARGVSPLVPEASPGGRMPDAAPLPFVGQLGRFSIKLPPASGAELLPEGSATLLEMSVDSSRAKEMP